MKKYMSVILAMLMLLGLCACGGEEKAAPQPQTLQVGFGRVDITPQLSVPLAGYGNTAKRLSLAAQDPLYATCVALTDKSGETLLLISQDLINSTWHSEARAVISEATGVPVEHIMVAGTHTHSAPDQTSTLECIQTYKKDYLDNMAAVASAAMNDRCEGAVYAGKTKLERMNGVRHYLMADGTYAGDNFGSFENNTVVEPAEAKDDILQVIRFSRKDKQDVVMVNWQAHPAKNGSASSHIISADFVGAARTAFEKSSGDLFVYFTGAAGNQNPSSRLESECTYLLTSQYGQALAEAVTGLLKNMDTPAVTSVKTKQITYTGQTNRDMAEMLEQAKEVNAVYEAHGKAAAEPLVQQYGFVSIYHARAIITRSEYDDTIDMELSAASIGDISFIAAPYEMFSIHGTYIKEKTP